MSDFLIFVVTFAAFAATFIGLALGLLQNKPLKGSCGGLSNVTGESCNICGASSSDACDGDAETRAR